MLEQHEVRRRLDGSIDIDFYRQRGLMERRAVMTGFFTGLRGAAKPVVSAAVLMATLYMAHEGSRNFAASDAERNSASLHGTRVMR